jgi:TonB family protein
MFTISIAAIAVTEAVPLPPVVVTMMKVESPEPGVKPAAAPQRTRIGNGDAVPNNAVVPPRVLKSTPPAYTDEAVLANVEGTVTLEGHVDIKGKVSGLRVVKGLGHGLDQKAIEAVLGWKFGPALRIRKSKSISEFRLGSGPHPRKKRRRSRLVERGRSRSVPASRRRK